jgi:RNA polymerase sigma-70 factor, ECF subfamily
MTETGINAMVGPAHSEKIDDKSLVGNVQLDRDIILETIIREYSSDIARLANRLLGWPGDVDDIVQDVFLVAYTGLGKFRRDCDIKTWLFTITINKCRTYRYKKILNIRFFEKLSAGPSCPQALDADENQIKDETFERVLKAVSDLPVKYREPVVLKYLQQMTTADITKILGIAENVLNVRLTWARKILKQKLEVLIKE